MNTVYRDIIELIEIREFELEIQRIKLSELYNRIKSGRALRLAERNLRELERREADYVRVH